MLLVFLLSLLPVLVQGQGQCQVDDETLARISALEQANELMNRQLMLQQFYVHEKVRTDGHSGIKQARVLKEGTKTYHTASFAGPFSIAAIHEHTDHDGTCGMGEMAIVLNGVDFKTRHVDFKLIMPANNGTLHATEEVPYPDVPPTVSSQPNVQAEIDEMREYFKAWRDEDESHRDYKPYFKPLLCYLEGAWYHWAELEEVSESDRHQFDATSWFELEEQARYTAYSGDKQQLENFAQLPRKIINITEDGLPVFAQWNYRVLCHPIQTEFPRSHLRMVDDLASRMKKKLPFDELGTSRLARFDLDENTGVKSYRLNLLDQIMAEIPGMDNYPGSISDTVLGITKLDANDESLLNTARYNRWFKTSEPSASGQTFVHRGFSDPSMFVAENTQPAVAPIDVDLCLTPHSSNQNCQRYVRRYSYAIPLEIVYTTPLHKWNPYGIEHKGWHKSDLGKTVTAGARGGNTADPNLAFNGTNSAKFYRTPEEFYSGGDNFTDMADTPRTRAGVLDPAGNLHVCRASGIRTITQEIAGVGSLRQRYPIMPVHQEGSAAYKEIDALKDVVMEMETYLNYFREPPVPGCAK